MITPGEQGIAAGKRDNRIAAQPILSEIMNLLRANPYTVSEIVDVMDSEGWEINANQVSCALHTLEVEGLALRLKSGLWRPA